MHGGGCKHFNRREPASVSVCGLVKLKVKLKDECVFGIQKKSAISGGS